MDYGWDYYCINNCPSLPFSFSYEVGYCGVFDLPLNFISVSLTTILVAVSGLIIIMISIFLLINLSIMAGVFNFSNPVNVSISRTIVFSLVLVSYILLYGKQWREWVWVAGILAVSITLDFILPLIDQRGKGNYRDKLVAQQEMREKFESLPRLLNIRFGNTGITIFLIILYGLIIAHTAGKAHARQQEEFLVIDQSPEVVVLRAYGDYLFTAPFDRSTKEIEKKFVIFKLSDGSPTSVTLEKVGPLRVKTISLKPQTSSVPEKNHD